MELPSVAETRRLQRELLQFFQEQRRDLPWRNNPTPYQVWVSEVMLQQTRVEVVKDYYRRWMQAFPDIQSLAGAAEDDVLRLWQGLGYYSRARRLAQGARFVLEQYDGAVPAEPEELLKIPGIGPYSAGAIASIAHGRAAPLVDGNVIRVLCRRFGLFGDPTRAPLQKEIWRLAAHLVPRKAPGDFNQALMELGATVCTPRQAQCFHCRLRKDCRALSAGAVDRLPELPPRKKPQVRTFVVFIFRYRRQVGLLRAGEGSRWWAGLHCFPLFEVAQLNPHLSSLAAQAKKGRQFLLPGSGDARMADLKQLTPATYSAALGWCYREANRIEV
ncbi:MAG: A/G-specific adenine glycosylase, partial [Polyangiaceae bacterium]|nr:A/G-specific adenine glycosylase [Polyangiaceae bacterium]